MTSYVCFEKHYLVLCFWGRVVFFLVVIFSDRAINRDGKTRCSSYTWIFVFSFSSSWVFVCSSGSLFLFLFYPIFRLIPHIVFRDIHCHYEGQTASKYVGSPDYSWVKICMGKADQNNTSLRYCLQWTTIYESDPLWRQWLVDRLLSIWPLYPLSPTN